MGFTFALEPRWSFLVYVDHSGGIDNLWGQPIDGGAPKQLTNFEDSQILSFGWLKDGVSWPRA